MQSAQILVVDDCPDTTLLLKSILSTAGYSVHSAGYGQQALNWLKRQNNRPQLILLDIDLPDLSGYDVCETLQADPDLALIPVIMVTGRHHADSRLQAFQMGAVGFVTKPVVSDYLLEQVKKALSVQAIWEQNLSGEEQGPEGLEEAQPAMAEWQLQVTKVETAPELDLPQHSTEPEAEQQVVTVTEPPLGSSLPVLYVSKAGVLKTEYQTSGLTEFTQPERQLKKHMSFSFTGFVQSLLSECGAATDTSFAPELLYEQAFNLGFSPEQVVSRLAEYTGLPLLTALQAEQIKLGVLPAPFCRRYQIVPFANSEASLAFALAHPFTIEVSDALRPYQEAPLYLISPTLLQDIFLAPSSEPKASANLAELMHEMNQQYNPGKPQEDLTATLSAEELEELEALEEHASAPMIRLVNRIIEAGYQQGASDIHIEAREEGALVRYRIDGVLQDQHLLKPLSILPPLVARLKIMADLNIAEKRLPQDGRIVYQKFTRRQLDFDLRIAIAPMNFGEKVVMRIIDKQKTNLPLGDLGFSEGNLKRYRELIQSPYGMILHVGPTGSGKSMTLYSALNEINSPEINIQTAEDPIEYTLPRLNQLQVQPEIGLTFARALRAYLRQDPDVILVGEIRDPETAHIAAEAALTGHLLLSTLHTNDAPSTLTRLVEMGVSPFMLSPSVVMICAQRLIRRLCQLCAEAYSPSAHERQLLGLAHDDSQTRIYRAKGCELCRQTGFKGRLGIHELLIPSERLRAALTEPKISSEQLKRLAVADGMVTLYWDAMLKVRQGVTSLEEALNHVKPDEFDSRPADF